MLQKEELRMKTQFVLLLSRGEWDDHVIIPIAVVQDLATAIVLREALEDQEEYYMNLLIPEEFRQECPSIDIQEVPFVMI